MSGVFFLNMVVALVVMLLITAGFFNYRKHEKIRSVTNWFSFLFFVYAVLTILFGLWFFDYLSYSFDELYFIYAVAMFAQTFFLAKVLYLFSRRKGFFYLLLLYLVAFVVAVLSFSFLPFLLLLTSFFLTLLFSFYFLTTSETARRTGYACIVYACVSLILLFLFFFEIVTLSLLSLISGVSFCIFVFLFFRDVGTFSITSQNRRRIDEGSHVFVFLRYFVYIIVLTNFVLLSTVSVHELGHVFVARYYGCDSRAIAFEQGTYPYSEISCDSLDGKVPIALAGPLLPIVIAFVLFVVGGRFVRPIALLMIGFNLLASYKDFSELALGESIVLTSTIAGILFLLFGVALLARSRTSVNSP